MENKLRQALKVRMLFLQLHFICKKKFVKKVFSSIPSLEDFLLLLKVSFKWGVSIASTVPMANRHLGSVLYWMFSCL